MSASRGAADALVRRTSPVRTATLHRSIASPFHCRSVIFKLHSACPVIVMNRSLIAASWIFFFATMYLILAEAVSPWFGLPGLGNIGFTLAFVLFSLLHCAVQEGVRFTAVFFAISAFISYVFEEIGVRTGLIYGSYHYSDMLGAKLGHVPIIIPLAWFMMIYPSWMVARSILRGTDLRSFVGVIALALVAALTITGWDMVMDPGMARAHNWIWEQGGSYFGVPLRNYFGWILTTFLVYFVAGIIWRKRSSEKSPAQIFTALPAIVYTFFGLRYITADNIPALKAIALFSMGFPGLLALIRLWTALEP
jgi:uncharacterized membrane protein